MASKPAQERYIREENKMKRKQGKQAIARPYMDNARIREAAIALRNYLQQAEIGAEMSAASETVLTDVFDMLRDAWFFGGAE
jgi:hypothetical protein